MQYVISIKSYCC